MYNVEYNMYNIMYVLKYTVWLVNLYVTIKSKE